MKRMMAIFGIIFPLLTYSQSIDVSVEGANYEFSGGEYDVNSSVNDEVVIKLFVKNFTDSTQHWKLERLLPSAQFWDEHYIAWWLDSDPLTGNDFIIFPTQSWISPLDITVPTNDSIHLHLAFEPNMDGCDYYNYYLLHNDIRVDSFAINICKAVGLNEDVLNSVEIYPIPAHSDLNLHFHYQIPKEIKIMNLLGIEMVTFVASQDMKISTENFSNGIYFITWKVDGIHFSQKFQVQH